MYLENWTWNVPQQRITLSKSSTTLCTIHIVVQMVPVREFWTYPVGCNRAVIQIQSIGIGGQRFKQSHCQSQISIAFKILISYVESESITRNSIDGNRKHKSRDAPVTFFKGKCSLSRKTSPKSICFAKEMIFSTGRAFPHSIFFELGDLFRWWNGFCRKLAKSV